MLWLGMVWYGVAWYGVLWYGMIWCGVVWYGIVWHGMVWNGKACPAADVAETKQEIGLNQDLTNQNCCCLPIICSERQNTVKSFIS